MYTVFNNTIEIDPMPTYWIFLIYCVLLFAYICVTVYRGNKNYHNLKTNTDTIQKGQSGSPFSFGLVKHPILSVVLGFIVLYIVSIIIYVLVTFIWAFIGMFICNISKIDGNVLNGDYASKFEGTDGFLLVIILLVKPRTWVTICLFLLYILDFLFFDRRYMKDILLGNTD